VFNRLPGYRKTPPGLERVVLRRLPGLTIYGTLALCLPALLGRLPFFESDERFLASTDIWVASLVILHWTVLFTIAIAAFIVMVMKGPAYVADAYPLDEADDVNPHPD